MKNTMKTRITTARFALYGKPLPRWENAVQVGEWVRNAVMSAAKKMLGPTRIPAKLSGHSKERKDNHQHAFYLPEDADHDGYIDHFIVHLPGGMDDDIIQILQNLTRIYAGNKGEWVVILEDMMNGHKEPVIPSPLLGMSPFWRSWTPYLHPWFVKKKFGVVDQIKKECRLRGLPEIVGLQPLPSIRVGPRQRTPVHFRRFRSKRGLTQPDRRGSFWEITFAEPIRGPLALGFGCHFGLGIFRPLMENHD